MKNPTPLQIGEKIRQIRAAKGLSQENLAHAIGKSKSLVSRLERGDSEFDHQTLEATKKYLGIEKAPLHEHELEIYRNRIWTWNELVHNKRMDEAKAMREELSNILGLPFEQELIMLFKLIEARILYTKRDDSAVYERLNYVEGFLGEACSDVLYLYHRVKGIILMPIDANNALKNFLQAHKYNNHELRPDVLLLYNIGFAYVKTGRPIIAMRYLERFKGEYRGDSTHTALSRAETLLAACHLVLGELDEVKTLYESALVKARNSSNRVQIGIALGCMGFIHGKTGNYKKACDFYNDALEYVHEADDYYVRVLILKAGALIGLNDYDAGKSLLEQAKALAGNDEELTILIEDTRHYMTLNDKQSTDYLESVVLPYYIRNGLAYIDAAISLCDTLETQYRKRGATRKADAIGLIARDIYKGMIYGPEDSTKSS